MTLLLLKNVNAQEMSVKLMQLIYIKFIIINLLNSLLIFHLHAGAAQLFLMFQLMALCQ